MDFDKPIEWPPICDNCDSILIGGNLALRAWPNIHPDSNGKVFECIDLKFCDVYCLECFIHSKEGSILVDTFAGDKEK